MLIPSNELVLLERSVAEAHELAEAGQVTEGYDLLDLMLCYAESPAFDLVTLEISPRDAWADELAARYRRALVSFCRKFSLTFPKPFSEPLSLPERVAELVARSRKLRGHSTHIRQQGRAFVELSRVWQAERQGAVGVACTLSDGPAPNVGSR